jgi:hypothetical protein
LHCSAARDEVDFILEAAGRLVPIEVKLASTPHPEMASGVHRFQSLAGKRAGHGFVVLLGGRDLPAQPHLHRGVLGGVRRRPVSRVVRPAGRLPSHPSAGTGRGRS